MADGIRIPPLDPATFSSRQKDLVGDWSGMNFCRVMVRHPDVYQVFLPYLSQLVTRTTLPPRDREILVLRSLALAGDHYETRHHVDIAHKAGLTDTDIKAVQTNGEGLSDFERLLMYAVDELMREQKISDQTWHGLAQRYDEIQLMEVVFLVGCYTAMGMITNTFGIPLETEAETAELNRLRGYT